MKITVEPSDIRPGAEFISSTHGRLLVIYSRSGNLTVIALDRITEIKNPENRLHVELNAMGAIPAWIKPAYDKENARLLALQEEITKS